ncbi:MAG: relaxase/mobilization nuclease domain-containing protein, partial [Oscillospiraceae bacterium]|nr:relaxase/mobilization nuclease domain-containing protein [Oscillospiraceae bacterium]
MATTRLITIHISKGKSAGGSFAARLDYASNPEKTEDGQLVTSFACDPMTAANEFELMRRTYLNITGRHRDGEVIAYQLRQSFKPGEVTPEEANQIGRELAGRFLKGNHAYIVATHTDKAHIHNHIIFCATTLDCQHKFRNFLGSGKALARLSDQICMEHKLSVVSNPRMHDTNYDRWQGD